MFSLPQTGTLAKVCRSKQIFGTWFKQGSHKDVHHVDEDDRIDGSPAPEYNLFSIRSSNVAPLSVTVRVDGEELMMEVDTGATKSLISMKTFNQLWKETGTPILHMTTTRLRTYTGEAIKVAGILEVEVALGKQRKQLELLVVDDDGPSLFGRDWLTKLKLDWCQLNQVRATDGLQRVLDSHKNVFDDELGKVKDVQARIHITPEAMPVFCRARTVPYALREKIEEEISRLQDQGIIEPVRFSDWAAPVVPVVKSDGRIRLCEDYKVTINRASKIDKYPLPRIDDLLTTLAGGKRFSKLDLAHAYLQVPLELDSKKFTTINTHKGLYQYTRLPFGISSAPAIFQRIMENILRDVPRVRNILG